MRKNRPPVKFNKKNRSAELRLGSSEFLISPRGIADWQPAGAHPSGCLTLSVECWLLNVSKFVVRCFINHLRSLRFLLLTPPQIQLESLPPYPETLPHMNRIAAKFAQLKSAGKKGFVVYIGGGDPDLKATHDLALAFDHAGVDVLEIGVPFSDPLADGLVNQLAAQRGLESGATPPKVLETVATIRKSSQIPIVLYIYFNLIHKVGAEKFIADAAKAGVDGLLVLDLPPEESDNYEALMQKHGLCNIYLVAPTTPEDRMALIVKRGQGFIYYISREGVTGMQSHVATNLASQVAKIRAHTSLPIAVGFGISNPDQAKLVAQDADACVVGSAIVNQIAEHGKSPGLVQHVATFVKSLGDAVKTV